jgi:hypothetical protein
MTTSEFIKMLQEADPKGTAHVRMPGGVPIDVQLLPGYYDGAYSYIDDEGNYVTSRTGNKVDIYTRDREEFVEHHFDLHDPNNWEEIKSKFIFDGVREDSIESYIKSAKKYWDEEYEWEMKSFKESEERAIKYTNEGWTWFQNKLVDDESIDINIHHYYTWQIFDAEGNKQNSNVYNVQGVYKSDLFERVDNNKKEGYYEWVIKK